MYNNSSQHDKNFRFAIILLLLGVLCRAPYATGQSIAETATTTAAGTTAAAAAAAAAAKTLHFPSVEIKGGSGASVTSSHLQTPSGPPPQIINRRAFEQHAGPDAGKLLIRSGTPSISYVWIDDKYVGPTPVTLALPPGKHHLFLRGPRNESGDSVVDVPPRGTREVAPALTTPYRSKFTIR
jgi:PEGA domain